ncbi:MAG TPA: glycoside hydrolase [Sphingomonadaceae bacterium]
MRLVNSLLAGVLLLAGPVSAAAPAVPPKSLHLDPFYAKYLDAGGIPVTSSAKVPDAVLQKARSIVLQMLAHRPDLRAELVREGYRVVIMAESESTLDLPEQAGWKKPARDDIRLTRCEIKHYDERIGRLTDREYWDWRARGMGGQLTSGAVEDLLGLRTSRYYGETIFVHEFGHDVLQAIRAADPALYAAVGQAYAHAKAADLWHDEYAMTTVDEYWANGTQFWFNSNKLEVMNGRRILSDADLKAYDPALYAVLGRAYGTRHHLTGDPFYNSPARIPPGPIPANTAEVC